MRPIHIDYRLVLLAFLLCQGAQLAGESPSAFVTYEEAKSTIASFKSSLPAGLSGLSPVAMQEQWPAWVKSRDVQVRARLEQGEEDTLTNLLRYGVTYTKQPRIEWPLLFQYGKEPAATTLAESRAEDLVRGLSAPGTNEHLLTMRAFVIKEGHSPTTASGRAALKKYLLANLARMRTEYLAYLEQRKKVESGPRDEAKWLDLNSHLYARRGISLDSDLLPDYAVDSALKVLASKAMISAGSIRRVAIVGPGLDFVNKENGTDLYPPQTVQPFAVVDSLLRLQLADPARLQLFTYDISSNVNNHLSRARQKATQGAGYRMHLPLDGSVQWSADYKSYWQSLGARIGSPAASIQVPEVAASLQVRAVEVRPDIVRRITPVDMNIVFQYMALAPLQRFDLIVGTNVFVYYGALEQSLARENLARMLVPGGILISNTLLSGVPSSSLKEIARVKALYSESKAAEMLFIYQRK